MVRDEISRLRWKLDWRWQSRLARHHKQRGYTWIICFVFVNVWVSFLVLFDPLTRSLTFIRPSDFRKEHGRHWQGRDDTLKETAELTERLQNVKVKAEKITGEADRIVKKAIIKQGKFVKKSLALLTYQRRRNRLPRRIDCARNEGSRRRRDSFCSFCIAGAKL